MQWQRNRNDSLIRLIIDKDEVMDILETEHVFIITMTEDQFSNWAEEHQSETK